MTTLLEQMRADAESNQAPTSLLAQMHADAAATGPVASVEAAPRTGTGSGLLDSLNAVGSGFWRGATRLAGLPVDTANNIVDIGKAGMGATYIAATGKAPPAWLELGDRADVVGSGENLIKHLGKTKLGSLMVNPANPEFEGGYLQNLGGSLAGATTPGQAVLGAVSTTLGKVVGDSTGSPALAITASLAPSLTLNPIAAATKYAIRGGEAGRQRMQDRISVLRAAGVNEPTLGLASGNQVISGAENILSQTPGAMGSMARARARTLGGLQGTVDDAVAAASPTRGELPTGAAIQGDLGNFYDARVRPAYVRLNDQAEGVIGSGTPVQVTNAVNATSTMAAPHPGAPAITGSLVQPRIRQWNADLRSDQGGAPPFTDGAGMYHPAVPPVGLPYGAVKALRTSIGDEAGSAPIRGTPEQGQIKQVYGALSQDMNAAAVQSDLNNGQILSVRRPTSATGALTRANDMYSAGMNRLDAVAPFANAKAPEAAYDMLINSAKSRNSVAQTLMKTVEPETRGAVAATFLDNLGKAGAGHQNASGDVWSPETFLTNWNKMSPQAQKTLTSGFPGAGEVQTSISAVTEAADLIRQNKMWTNPSGTAVASAVRNGVAGLGAVLGGFVSPWAVPAAAAGFGAVNYAGRKLTDPNVVRWASEKTPFLSGDINDLGTVARAAVSSGQLDQPAPRIELKGMANGQP